MNPNVHFVPIGKHNKCWEITDSCFLITTAVRSLPKEKLRKLTLWFMSSSEITHNFHPISRLTSVLSMSRIQFVPFHIFPARFLFCQKLLLFRKEYDLDVWCFFLLVEFFY